MKSVVVSIHLVKLLRLWNLLWILWLLFFQFILNGFAKYCIVRAVASCFEESQPAYLFISRIITFFNQILKLWPKFQQKHNDMGKSRLLVTRYYLEISWYEVKLKLTLAIIFDKQSWSIISSTSLCDFSKKYSRL